jgi:murein DD-endopeptidase MepM/ murein hydrolase activator NlpD
MRMWTVLVMPHDQGNTKTLHVYSGQLWAIIAVLAGLTFTTTFIFGRYRVALAEAQLVKGYNSELQSAVSQRPQESGLADDERARLESKIRAEFGQKDQQIEQKLSELYDLEKQVREIHGVPAKVASDSDSGAGPVGNGKGGGAPGDPLDPMMAFASVSDSLSLPQPPTVIYGLSNPSADLIVAEIDLRKASLQQLVDALDAKRESVERTPSVWPTRHPRAYISSNFGYRIDPISRDVQRHTGIDFPSPYGATVLATAKGVVKEAYYDRWYGNLVKIDHGNGLQTWYGHMSKLSVTPGQHVQRGEKLGEVGSTGRSTGAHIHYEVHVNGVPVNPMKYIG